jgi:hypothetical protein
MIFSNLWAWNIGQIGFTRRKTLQDLFHKYSALLENLLLIKGPLPDSGIVSIILSSRYSFLSLCITD